MTLQANPMNLKIGVIGGGQLGKMMLLEAKKMGFYAVILDPSKHCPASSICDEHIIAAFNDKKAIRLLSEKSDIITYEFEHIDSKTLLELENEGKAIYPAAKSLCIIQDKLAQKTALSDSGLPVPDFMDIKDESDLCTAANLYGVPFILKTRTGGYDGKGNYVVRGNDFAGAFNALGGGEVPLMAERYISFDCEVSVLACRSISGEIAVYPVGLNIHKENILDETRVPAPIPESAKNRAMELARQVMEIFEGVGMFCTEMFICGESVYVNEVAPRPHNSGHYSIEGCVTSQFEQHIRAITGLPLGDASLVRPSVMRNILGEPGFSGRAIVSGAEKALYLKGVKLHIYGKEDTAPKRKMGHLTVTADTIQEAAEIAEQAKRVVKIVSEINTCNKY